MRPDTNDLPTGGTRRRGGRLRTATAVAAMALLVAAGCSDDDTATSDTATSDTTATTAAAGGGTTGTGGDGATGSSAGALAGSLPETVAESGAIRFGALWETPPVIGVDPADTSTPVGFAPDMAEAMAELLGVEARWENMQWPAQLPGVQAGTVDALFGQVTITEERERSVVDLIPYLRQTESLLLNEGENEDVAALADACGLTIGVPIGSTQGEMVSNASEASCVAAGEPAIEMAEYQGASAAVSALGAGTIDAWFDTTLAIETIVTSAGGSFRAVQLPEEEAPARYSGIAVGKDQPQLSEALAEAIRTLIEDGRYDALLSEHGLSVAAITADDVVINPLTGTEPGAVAE